MTMTAKQLLGKVVQSPSLEVSKEHINMALQSMIQWAYWCWLDGWR